MDYKVPKRINPLVELAPIWILFILGIWLVVIRPLGPALSLVPGDLGDARFNNYLLEHFYRWILGLDKSFWNAPFFYPFPSVIAFSDNLLGGAPFYALFRAFGLDRESAFLGWFILGYTFNYAAAAYVLHRMKLKPLAVAVAAFFFTFGLPQLAQENHAQLLYRFGIPAACYLLWVFYQEPRLRTLTWLVFWTAWQLFAGIYIGIFLILMLAVIAVLLPIFYPLPSKEGKSRPAWLRLLFGWPVKLGEAWSRAGRAERAACPLIMVILAGCLAVLLWPYFRVTSIYGFYRGWSEVTIMLPRVRSYFFADSSQIWGPLSARLANINGRHEHQLFPGGTILALALVGSLFRFKSEQRRWAFANLAVLIILIVSTFDFHGFAFYRFVWALPGMKSIRAVTRFDLVMMWPLACFGAYVVDALIRRGRLWITIVLTLAAGLLLAESVFYNHITYSKADNLARIDSLRAELPASVPADPILFIATPRNEPYFQPELDGMILSQELGWPTLNGYSGNFPLGFAKGESCVQLPHRITNYMTFKSMTDPSFYTNMIKRVVPIGFNDCDPAWWSSPPR